MSKGLIVSIVYCLLSTTEVMRKISIALALILDPN